ncbi:MAG: DNA topoisomerase IB [Bacteroidetes bacterium]|nr:DNA topoisomerase IB [Bacteroidota bacterium]
MLLLNDEISLSNSTLRDILHDPEKTAKAVNLVYVCDTQPGISRIRKGDKFVYMQGDEIVKDEKVLERIKKLVIPPAWNNVWVCPLENGHLQVTGLDVKNRKQYKYHSLWNSLRNHTKFYRLHSFGKVIPAIRKRIEEDLCLPGLPLNKVLAAVVCLMERTSIRIGNNMYEKLYGSFGLTTLKNKHVKIVGSGIQFIFKGKKGITHNISIKSKRLAVIVKKCKEIPGKELFQYYDHEGHHKCIDSGMVNHYLKSISGEDFTAKDFRTWAGTVHAIMAFREIGNSDTLTGTKKNIVTALDHVSEHLGNTRTVCKKYYVHPTIISLYENKTLTTYLKAINKFKKCAHNDLECEEKLLMKILEKEGLVA